MSPDFSRIDPTAPLPESASPPGPPTSRPASRPTAEGIKLKSRYTVDDLASFLASCMPVSCQKFAPGDGYQYSNVGSGALGYILSRDDTTGDVDFGAMVRREISNPLGIPDTTILLSRDQEPRRIQIESGDEAADNGSSEG